MTTPHAPEQFSREDLAVVADRLADRLRPVVAMGDDLLLNAREAAVALAKSPKTLELWRSEGRGPRVTRIGSAVSYRLGDIREFIRRASAS